MSQPEVVLTEKTDHTGREKSKMIGKGKNPVLLRVYYKGPIPDHYLRARQTRLTEYFKFINQQQPDYVIEIDPITGRETIRID